MIKIALNIFIVVIFVFVFNNVKKDVIRIFYQVFEGFENTNTGVDGSIGTAQATNGATNTGDSQPSGDANKSTEEPDNADSNIQECAKNCLKPEFITGNCESEIITKETVDGKKHYRHCPYSCMNKYDKDYVNYDQSSSDKPYVLERDGCRYSQQCNGCGKELIEVDENGVGLKKYSPLIRKFTESELSALRHSSNGTGTNNNMGINNLANQSEGQYNSMSQPKQNINRNTSNMYGNNPEIKNEKYGDYLYENRVSAQLYGDPYTKDYHPQDPNKKPAAYNSLMSLF